MLNNATKSIKFAHLVFWYIVAGLDSSESIQLSQHKHPKIWNIINNLINTWESQGADMSEERKKEEEFFSNVLNLPKIQSSLSDTGSSGQVTSYI